MLQNCSISKSDILFRLLAIFHKIKQLSYIRGMPSCLSFFLLLFFLVLDFFAIALAAEVIIIFGLIGFHRCKRRFSQ